MHEVTPPGLRLAVVTWTAQDLVAGRVSVPAQPQIEPVAADASTAEEFFTMLGTVTSNVVQTKILCCTTTCTPPVSVSRECFAVYTAFIGTFPYAFCIVRHVSHYNITDWR